MDRKLPDWLKESRKAEKLIAWLKSPDCEVKRIFRTAVYKGKIWKLFLFSLTV